MIRQSYDIRIEGTLPESLTAVFLPWQADVVGSDTVIHGVIADQAELGGLLQTVDSLGLRLIEVRPTAERHQSA